jgi:hypothetical protein
MTQQRQSTKVFDPKGSFQNGPSLIPAIRDDIDNHNQNPQVLVWTAREEQILKKVAKSKEVLDALRQNGS